MAEESIVVFLRAQIGEFTGKMREAGGEVDALGKKGESGFAKFQAVGSAALLAVGAAAVAGGAMAIKMALDYEQSHARLVTAVHNNGEEFDAYKDKIESTAKQLQNLGFDDADMEASLATLTGVTHDTGKALNLMGLAADIARGRHIDLASATGILVKVESGHVGALGRLGIATKDVNGKTISQEAAIRKLSDLYGGQASAYAGTFAGKIEVLKTKTLDLVEGIGLKLIPVVEKFVSVGLGVLQFFDHVNEATGGWLGKLLLLGGGGALAAIAILKLVSAGRAAEEALAKMAAKFVLVQADGSLALSTMGKFGLAAGAVAVGLGFIAFAHHENTKAAEETDHAHQKLIADLVAGGDAARKAGDALKTGYGSAVAGLVQDYVDQSLAGKGATLSTEELTKKINEAGPPYIKAFGWSKNLATQIKAQTDAMGPAAKKTAELSSAQQKYADLLASGTASERDLESARRGVVAASTSNADVQNKVNAATQEGTDKTAKNTDATKDNTAAVQARITALTQERDAVLGALGADLSMQDSLQALSRDVDDYNAKQQIAIATHGQSKKATDDLSASSLQLKHGILDVAQAAIADAKAFDAARIAKGENVSADQQVADQNRAAIGALRQLEQRYPALTALIQAYVNQLNQIPATKTTVVTVQQNIGPGGESGQRLPGGLRRYATGGIADVPVSGALAVLHGREAILPLNDKRRSLEILQESGLLDRNVDSGKAVAAAGGIATGAAAPLNADQIAAVKFIGSPLVQNFLKHISTVTLGPERASPHTAWVNSVTDRMQQLGLAKQPTAHDSWVSALTARMEKLGLSKPKTFESQHTEWTGALQHRMQELGLSAPKPASTRPSGSTYAGGAPTATDVVLKNIDAAAQHQLSAIFHPNAATGGSDAQHDAWVSALNDRMRELGLTAPKSSPEVSARKSLSEAWTHVDTTSVQAAGAQVVVNVPIHGPIYGIADLDRHIGQIVTTHVGPAVQQWEKYHARPIGARPR